MAFGQWQRDGELKHQIEMLLDEQYKRVKVLLEANREAVIAIAEALLIREELDGDEVFEIVREVEERIARRAADAREAVPALVGAGTSEAGEGNGNGRGETAWGPGYESGSGQADDGHAGGNGHSGGNGYSGPSTPEPGNGHGDYPGATLG